MEFLHLSWFYGNREELLTESEEIHQNISMTIQFNFVDQLKRTFRARLHGLRLAITMNASTETKSVNKNQ